ncbi:MAG: serine/threonine-protein kinase [Clostridia bacterium]|nr:serine/threonine-protein kinase [Clostridia bacterium]
MRTVEERLKSYEPLWENWTYTGEFLGEGAMSSVFEIQSTAMGLRELAALKIITVKRDFRGEVKIPENALNEIKILRTLSGCVNIVQYHDSTQRQIFDENGTLKEIDILIKMEKLQPLSEGDNISADQVTKLAKDMCNALIHASEYSIIHRDIKPQNIFVDKDGTYKLGDFGIAKIVSDFSQNFTTNIGTMAYTAPEIYRNTVGTYDISSDIYSLGLVLYVFLNNGYLPFANNSSSLHDAIAKRLSGAPFPSPSNGSKSLKSIVMRACNSDLTKRYRTPQEMLEDLELLSTGGKKLVADPFATLDANAGEYESDAVAPMFADDSGTTVLLPHTPSTPSSHSYSGGLKINLGGKSVTTTPETPKKEPVSSTNGGVIINMGSKSKDLSDSKDGPDMADDSGSRLKINMGGKSTVPPPSVEVVVSKPENKEDNSESSFFSIPDSL